MKEMGLEKREGGRKELRRTGQKLWNLISEEHPVALSILLVLGAFLVRAMRVFQETVIAHDGIIYIKMAKIVASGDLQRISDYSFFNLYPVLIAFLQAFINDWELSGRLVSAVFGALTVVPFFLMIRKMTNSKIAFAASLFYMVSPHFLEYSSNVLRESSFWFFSITALWLAWEGIGSKKWYFFSLSSIFTGLSIFTRIEGMAILIVILVWIPLFLKRKDVGLKKVSISLLVFTFSFPMLMSPPLWMLKTRLGKWELGQVGGYWRNLPSMLKGSKEALEVSPDLLDETSAQFRGLVELSKRHRYLLFFSVPIYKFVKSISVVLFLLLLFAMFRRRCIPYSRNELAILIWFTIFFIISFLYMTKHFYLSTRHGLLMGFPALIWSGIGLYEIVYRIERWLGRIGQFSFSSRFVTTFVLLLVVILLLPKTILSFQNEKIVLKETGAYLKTTGYGKSKFVVQPEFMRVAFYADSEYVLLPPGRSFEDTMKFIKENQATLLIIDEKTIESYSKDLVNGLSRLNFEKIPLPPFGKKGTLSIILYRIQ